MLPGYWLILGNVVTQPVVLIFVPLWMTVIVTIMLSVLFAATWGRIFLSDIIYRQAQNHGGHRHNRMIEIAHRINPIDSKLEAVYIDIIIDGPKKIDTFYKTCESLRTNDGELSFATSLFNRAIAARDIGLVAMARMSIVGSLKFNPKDEKAKLMLSEIDAQIVKARKKQLDNNHQ